MNPIELMMTEHRLIEKVLDALEAYGAALEREEQVDSRRLSGFVAFLRGYADALHHGKEEDILFAALKRQGCPEDFSPVIAAICREHEMGRNLVDDLDSVARREQPWSERDRHKVGRAAREFVSMLRRHIAEEDDYVFPRAHELLDEGSRNLVVRSCERFESFKAGDRTQLERLAEELTRA